MNPACNFCNNTDDVCCPEADNKGQIVEGEQQYSDSPVFLLHGLLVAKDVVMPRENKGSC